MFPCIVVRVLLSPRLYRLSYIQGPVRLSERVSRNLESVRRFPMPQEIVREPPAEGGPLIHQTKNLRWNRAPVVTPAMRQRSTCHLFQNPACRVDGS
jgi:hypothetical protein